MKMGAEFWVDHVAAATLETISASEYARRHGISVAALYYWQHKLKAATVGLPKEVSTHAKAARVSTFVALRVTDTVAVQQHSLCALVLPSDMRLEMSALPSPEWLAALVRAVHVTQGVR